MFWIPSARKKLKNCSDICNRGEAMSGVKSRLV